MIERIKERVGREGSYLETRLNQWPEELRDAPEFAFNRTLVEVLKDKKYRSIEKMIEKYIQYFEENIFCHGENVFAWGTTASVCFNVDLNGFNIAELYKGENYQASATDTILKIRDAYVYIESLLQNNLREKFKVENLYSVEIVDGIQILIHSHTDGDLKARDLPRNMSKVYPEFINDLRTRLYTEDQIKALKLFLEVLKKYMDNGTEIRQAVISANHYYIEQAKLMRQIAELEQRLQLATENYEKQNEIVVNSTLKRWRIGKELKNAIIALKQGMTH